MYAKDDEQKVVIAQTVEGYSKLACCVDALLMFGGRYQALTMDIDSALEDQARIYTLGQFM
jgi:hypothetical protein